MDDLLWKQMLATCCKPKSSRSMSSCDLPRDRMKYPERSRGSPDRSSGPSLVSGDPRKPDCVSWGCSPWPGSSIRRQRSVVGQCLRRSMGPWVDEVAGNLRVENNTNQMTSKAASLLPTRNRRAYPGGGYGEPYLLGPEQRGPPDLWASTDCGTRQRMRYAQ